MNFIRYICKCNEIFYNTFDFIDHKCKVGKLDKTHKRWIINKFKTLKTNEICVVCLQDFRNPLPKDNINLIKHHVSYSPEKLALVHYECHKKIHHPDNTLPEFNQYKTSRKYYDGKKEN